MRRRRSNAHAVPSPSSIYTEKKSTNENAMGKTAKKKLCVDYN